MRKIDMYRQGGDGVFLLASFGLSASGDSLILCSAVCPQLKRHDVVATFNFASVSQVQSVMDQLGAHLKADIITIDFCLTFEQYKRFDIHTLNR